MFFVCNQLFPSCFSTYYFARLEIKISVFFNVFTGGQELCLESLGFVLCTDAHLRTDILKGHMRTSATEVCTGILLNCLHDASNCKRNKNVLFHLTIVRRGEVLPRRQSPWLAGYWMSLLAADQPQQWGSTFGVSTKINAHNTKNKPDLNSC